MPVRGRFSALHPERPDHLFYRAKDGLYSMYLPALRPGDEAVDEASLEDDNAESFASLASPKAAKGKSGPKSEQDDRSARRPLHEFIERAVLWSDTEEQGPARYRILDTFLSNAVSDELLKAMAEELVRRGGSLNVLVVAPDSTFARSRGAAIDQLPVKQLRVGLNNLIRALADARAIKERPLPSGATLYDLANALKTWERDPRVRVRVRYYASPASAPMYFLNDILATGRFSFGSSASYNPWSLIVRDPGFEGDLFRSYLREFIAIWKEAELDPVSDRPLSFAPESDPVVSVLALDLGALDPRAGVASERELLEHLCDQLDLSKAPVLRAAWPDDLVCLHRGTGASLIFLKPEQREALVDLALALMDTHDDTDLGLRLALAHGPVTLGSTSTTARYCLGAPLNEADRLTLSGHPGRILMTEAYFRVCSLAPWADQVTPPMYLPGPRDRINYRELMR